ncbi:hypothetical protein AVEN_245264-1 [Araneus ventricosus]|uniref:Uncharacterized protein n=1 Tax=Araneus ventricosus TaxID=182803 RepID=A0A4Y2EE46_ARAVE|nr:hypothetical protein AVEN_245264-1 [Araneus ventricosus]
MDLLPQDSRDRRVKGSKPESTEHPLCMCACGTLNHAPAPKVLPLVGRGSLEKGCQLRCRTRYLPAVQNYEVRPQKALVLLQKGR